jgi:predicted Zn-dependent peptidase
VWTPRCLRSSVHKSAIRILAKTSIRRRTLSRVEQDRGAAPVVLANGLPVIEIPMSDRLGIAIVIAFPGGARYEGPEEVGVAHFLEHMAFKGTERHRTARILNRSAESLGADLNGCTTDDHVEFTASVRAESAMPTIDLLTDISGQALVDKDLLEAERAVILQEIADDMEDPGTLADHRLIAAVFRDHRLATSTVGRRSDVEQLTHAQLLSFRDRQWSPAGGLFAIAGNLAHIDRGLLSEFLLRIPARPAPPPPPPIVPFVRRVEVQERDGDIAHLRLAYALPEFDLSRSRDRAIAEVYTYLLGGLPGSRLSDELREQRGLCYAIEGYWWGYRGAALLSVDCSLLASKVADAYERIEAIIADLSTHGPAEEEFLRARSYSVSSSALSFESAGARVDRAVYLMLQCGDNEIDVTAHLRALEFVTREDVAGFAAQVAPGPCVGCVGAVTAATFD